MTKPIVKHLMNGASVFVLSLAVSSAAMANYDDLSSDELREQFDEISQAEESFSGIGLYYSVVVSTDESSLLDQGVQAAEVTDELLAAAMGEGFNRAEIENQAFFSEELFGDGTRFVVGRIQTTTEDIFVILIEKTDGFRLVYRNKASSFQEPAVYYTQSSDIYRTLILENVTGQGATVAVTYDDELGSFLTDGDREELLATKRRQEVLQDSKAFISEVVWKLDYEDVSIRMRSSDTLFGYPDTPRSKEVIQPSGYSIAGPEFAGAKGHLQEPVPFAGFQYFADSGAALNKEYDARLNPIAPRMVSGVAIGRFKFDEQAVAQFGYSVRPEASRKCGADSFAVNGKEVELTGGLSRKLPFPAGEFDFEMSFTCDHSNPDLKIVFLNEEGLPLPSYDAGFSESITDRKPLGAVETTAAAVQVLNQTGFGKSEKEERVELIDFSAPVRLGDFNTTKDQMRKVLAFKFKPTETGLHQIDVRTISNVCRYIFQGGNSCLGRFPYSDPQTGEERQLIGWKLMHPATKITVSDRDNTQYYTQIEASQLYRGVRDNIIGFYVDDRDLQRGLDIRVEIGSSMALALNPTIS